MAWPVKVKLSDTLIQENTCAVLGHSLMAQTNRVLGLSSLTSLGTTATAVSNTHKLRTGQVVPIRGATQTEYNGDYAITRVDANTFTYTFAGSATATATTTTNLSGIVLEETCDIGMFSWLNSKLIGRLNLIYNAGWSGAHIEDVLSMVGTVIAKGPKYCVVNGLINTIVNEASGTVLTTAIPLLQAIYKALTNAGITVIAITETPLGSGHASNATRYSDIIAANNWIRNYCLNNPGMILLDAYSATVDPTSTVGAAAINMLHTDNLHWSPTGARAIGELGAAILDPLIPARNTLCTSAADVYNSASNPNAILPHPLFDGVAGGLGNGATGTVATGWVAYRLGGTVVAGTGGTVGAARADGFGRNQLITVTAGASGDGFLCYSDSAHASVEIGGTYYFEAACSATGLAACSGVMLLVQLTIDGVTTSVFANFAGTTVPFPQADISEVVFRTPNFTLTGTSITSLQCMYKGTFSGAGSGVFNVGRAQLRRVS